MLPLNQNPKSTLRVLRLLPSTYWIRVFGKEIQIQFNAIVQERCQGCQTNHASQLKHSCFWLEDDDYEVDGLLKHALANLGDISYLKAVCCTKILNLNLPVSLSYHRVNALKDLWE